MSDYFFTFKSGHVTVVDEEDAHLLREHNWRVERDMKNGRLYVRASIRARRGVRYRLHLHRMIAGTITGEHTDHKDGDGLNNRRGNLRRCSPQQNGCNRRITGGTSQYKGVFRIPETGRYRAGIKVNYKRKHLGCFASEKEAALAYNAAALEFFGEFALLNQVGS
jgi:hypothetical protein